MKRITAIRFLPIWMVLALLLTLFPTSVMSTSALILDVTVDQTTPQAGQNLTVKIYIEAASIASLGNYNFDLSFDPTILQYLSVSPGRIGATDMAVSASVIQPGTIRVTHIQTGSGLVSDGSANLFIAQINVQTLPETYGQSTAISLSNILVKTFAGGILDSIAGAPVNVTIQFPAVNVTISVPDQVPAGDTFVARINTSLVGNFNAYQFQLAYNPAVLRMDGVEDVSGVTDGQINGVTIHFDQWSYSPTGDPSKGVVRVLGHIPDNVKVTGSGYLAEVHFVVIGHDGDISALSFTQSPDFINGLFEFNKTDPITNVNWSGNLVSIISPYRITNHSPLPTGETGIGYSQTLGATGGIPPYTFAIQSGTLPAGLIFHTNGLISGVPTAVGTSTVVFKVTDATHAVATRSLDISIVGPPGIISASALPDGQTNVFYSQGLFAAGGKAPYAWTLMSGTLPPGLTLASTGIISGTPTSFGLFSNPLFKVTDSLGGVDSKTISINIIAGPGITTTSLPPAEVTSFYSRTLTVSGGTQPYTWSLFVPGSLPPGLTLNATTGLISGTPTGTGTFTISFKVTDSVGGSDSKALSITVAALPVITTTILPGGEAGIFYSQNLAVSGGVAPFNWAISSGSLPQGLTLSSGGLISGVPASAGGPYSFTVKVTDLYFKADTQPLNFSFVAPPSIATGFTLAVGAQNRAYSQTVSASGGATPYAWSLTGGALPGGLSLGGSNGVISGTPTTTGTFLFTLKVTDNLGGFATKDFSITINSAPVITTTSLPDGEVFRSYSQTLAATGGTPPLTFGLMSGSNLPSGFTLSSAGAISGTTTAAGTYSFVVKVTDSLTIVGTQSLSIVILPAPAIATASLASGEVNVPYPTQTLTASPGKAPYSWSITSGTLPGGLALNASTGAISGQPGAAGTFPLSFKVTDSLGGTGTRALSITIVGPPSISTASPLTSGAVNRAYNQSLAATGGITPYSWSLSGGALPGGLALSLGGVISGTPVAAGGFSFTVMVTDNLGGIATKNFTLTINAAPVILTTSLPDGEVSRPYSQTVTATGGSLPLTWALQSGTLPPGLTIASSTGAISGTASTAGTYNFVVKVTDSLAIIGTQSLSIVIQPAPSILTASLSGGEVNLTYAAQTLTAGSGKPPYSWSITSGALPGGLSLNASTGVITGLPSVAGTFSPTFKVTDSLGGSATKAMSITIVAAPSITTASPLPGGGQNRAYSQTLLATGGVAPYSWSQTAGTLPGGFTLSAGGVISGTAASTGTFSFTLMVADSLGGSVTKNFSITISAGPVITIVSLPDGEVSRPYSQAVTATGGSAPLTWALQSGTLPPGLTIASSTGVIAGTATTAGTYNFVIKVTDSLSVIGTQALSIIIQPAPSIATASLGGGEVNLAYAAQTLTANPGKAPYSWSITSGALPGGLSLNASTGVISGTPSVAGTFTPTFKVTDSLGGSATKALSISIVTNPSISTASPLTSGAVNRAYNQSLAATGGTTPYSWSLSGGALPGGLSLSPGGAISGTPGAAGGFSFTVMVTDNLGGIATKNFTLTINAAPVILTTSLPDGEVSRPYSQTVTATGGSAPLTWALQSGTLPPGLTIASSTGAISGTASTAGTYNFVVKVTDSLAIIGTQSLSIIIQPAPGILTASLGGGEVNLTYAHQTLTAVQGKAPYGWSITSGALPGGLTLNASTGVIAGTPSVAGTFTPTFKVTDSLGGSATKALSISIVTNPSITTASPLTSGAVNRAYNQNLAATGGITPYTWSLSGGALPGGLSLSPGGAISGTPNTAGGFSFTVMVTDNLGGIATKGFTLTINAAPVILTTSLPDGEVSRPYSQTVTATGGSAPLTWALQSGTLPPGLTIASLTGVITGTASTAGTYNFVVKVTDSLLIIGTQSLSIVIQPAPSILTASLGGGEVNLTYAAQTLTAVQGKAPYGWSITSGALPGGLTLNASTGVIAGTPSVAGTFTPTFKVTDSLGGSATRILSITVVTAVSINTNGPLSVGETGLAYSQSMTATGGLTPYIWSLSGGALPGGLSLGASTGAISGTASAAGTFAFTVKVTDGLGGFVTKDFSITINAAPAILTITLPDGEVSRPYSQTLGVSGGTTPLTWALLSGTLPPGLSIVSSTGVITGTASTAGTYNFVIKVTDSKGVVDTQSLSITIQSPPTFSTTSLAGGEVNLAYSQTLAVVQGVAPYSWSITSGALPVGLSLDVSTGMITGLPGATGTFSPTFKVTDSLGGSATRLLSFTVVTAVSITTNAPLSGGEIGLAYSQSLTASGGSLSYTWSQVGGTLPSGLSLALGNGLSLNDESGQPLAAGNGQISGTPGAAGSFNFTIKVTDSLGGFATKDYSITIAAALTITTSSLPGSQKDVAYSQTVVASGGILPYTWSVKTGSLPTGLSLAAGSGLISGPPNTLGNFSFTIKVTDNLGGTVTRDYSIFIVNTPTITTDPTLPGGELNFAYSQSLAVTAAVAPYTWTLVSGSLPAGLTFSSAGLISGTPTQTGDFTINVKVTDSFSPPNSVNGTFTLHIYPALHVSNTSSVEILKGRAFSNAISASGGKSGYQFAAVGLPGGLFLSAAGLISGQPTVWGNFSVVVTVTDSLSHSITTNMNIKVYMPYDANFNGVVDMGDVVEVERMIMQVDPPNIAADADADGQITVADITRIERVILELDPAT